MPDLITQTTAQSAVNIMLSSIGERPVANIDTTQRSDVIRAVAALNEVNVSLQTRGWWFNEEKKVELTPNADGEYILPDNATKFDAFYEYVDNFVQRGRRLYNTETFAFNGHTEVLLVNYVLLSPFDDMPETAKLYVARRATTLFQKRSVASPTLFEFTKEDESEAFGFLQEEELEHVDTNLTFGPGIADAVFRR